MKRLFVCVVLFLSVVSLSFAKYSDKKIYIWDGVKAEGITKWDSPMYLFSSTDSQVDSNDTKKPAVIICPGGSYHHHGMYNEGRDVANWFNSKGFTAFVLKYRNNGSGHAYPAMMQDLQRAIQFVRENADEYGIDPNKVGIIGFSAGGHLVTWQAEFSKKINHLESVGIKTDISLTPNWVCAVYPVVSMQNDIFHWWSRYCLFGTNSPTQEQKDSQSLEFHVSDDMPPFYLVACHDDPVVKFENSRRLYQAMIEKNIDVTFDEYEKGGHGFGMLNNKFMKENHWNEKLYQWLSKKGFAK